MPIRRIIAGTLRVTLVAGLISATGSAANDPHKIDAGIAPTKQLLQLMDTDQNGKISRREFINFMQAEFDRLDINHDGELDVHELEQLRVRPTGGYHR